VDVAIEEVVWERSGLKFSLGAASPTPPSFLSLTRLAFSPFGWWVVEMPGLAPGTADAWNAAPSRTSATPNFELGVVGHERTLVLLDRLVSPVIAPVGHPNWFRKSTEFYPSLDRSHRTAVALGNLPLPIPLFCEPPRRQRRSAAPTNCDRHR